MRKLFGRVATWLLLTIGRQKWGVTAVIFPIIVKNLGPWGALRWIAQNLPKYERALKDLGPMRANFICCVASLLNGCSYCTYAHGRAFELYYFKDHGQLFPLDDHELLSLIPLSDERVSKTLEKALAQAGLDEEIQLFRRIYAIKLLGEAPKPGEEFLAHACKMFDTLNYCSIESQLALDEAHDAVNWDKPLLARYAEARLGAGRRSVLLEEMLAVDEASRSSDGE